MKIRASIVLIGLLLAISGHAQSPSYNGIFDKVPVAPSGACQTNATPQVVFPGGAIYTCASGVWTLQSAGGGSGGPYVPLAGGVPMTGATGCGTVVAGSLCFAATPTVNGAPIFGATLPFPGIVYGTSANGGTVATGVQVASAIQSVPIPAATGSNPGTFCVMTSANSSAATGCGASTGITSGYICAVIHSSGATPTSIAQCFSSNQETLYTSSAAAFGSESYSSGSGAQPTLSVGAISITNGIFQTLIAQGGETYLQSTNLTRQIGFLDVCTHGTNATCGVATLASGTATISTTAISALAAAGAAGASINLVLQSCSSCGTLSVGTVTAGTSFVINSTNVLDASNVYWEIRKIN